MIRSLRTRLTNQNAKAGYVSATPRFLSLHPPPFSLLALCHRTQLERTVNGRDCRQTRLSLTQNRLKEARSAVTTSGASSPPQPDEIEAQEQNQAGLSFGICPGALPESNHAGTPALYRTPTSAVLQAATDEALELEITQPNRPATERSDRHSAHMKSSEPQGLAIPNTCVRTCINGGILAQHGRAVCSTNHRNSLGSGSHASYITRLSALDPNKSIEPANDQDPTRVQELDHDNSTVQQTLAETLDRHALDSPNANEQVGPEADPVWTWNAPRYVTGDNYGIQQRSHSDGTCDCLTPNSETRRTKSRLPKPAPGAHVRNTTNSL